MTETRMISTRFQKSIKDPNQAKSILKPGSNNAKLGFNVTAKKWTGKKLYSLTLVERETCDSGCFHWDDCYGNNMPFSHRFKTEGLITVLRKEIESLIDKHKEGIVIRLHVLGDFYSTLYIDFWSAMLWNCPTLCVFGYTGHPEDSMIGNRIKGLNHLNKDQCLIRFSKNKSEEYDTSYACNEDFEGDCFDCPEQKGKIDSCASCGLCWIATKTVKFYTH